MFDQDKKFIQLLCEDYASILRRNPKYRPHGSQCITFHNTIITRNGVKLLVQEIRENAGKKPLIYILNEFQITMENYALIASKKETGMLPSPATIFSIYADVGTRALELYDYL